MTVVGLRFVVFLLIEASLVNKNVLTLGYVLNCIELCIFRTLVVDVCVSMDRYLDALVLEKTRRTPCNVLLVFIIQVLNVARFAVPIV